MDNYPDAILRPYPSKEVSVFTQIKEKPFDQNPFRALDEKRRDLEIDLVQEMRRRGLVRETFVRIDQKGMHQLTLTLVDPDKK